MITRLLDALQAWASRRNVLLLLTLYVVIIGAFLPLAHARLAGASGLRPLDQRLGYTPLEAYAALAAYDAGGRRLYALVELSVDLAYAFVSGLFYSLTIIYCFQRALPNSRWLPWLALLPLIALAFDLVENAFILTLLVAYPRQLLTIATAASVVTTTKWAATVVSIVVLLIGLVAVIARRGGPGQA